MKYNATMLKRDAKTFFYGCLMGVSDAVPGVSGATIALILGIYEKLILSLSFCFNNVFKPMSLLKGKEFWFIAKLYFGVFIALFAFLNIMNTLIKTQETKVFSFFIGLIAASIIVLSKKNWSAIGKNIAFGVIGFALGFLILSLSSGEANHSLPVIFGSGFVAISAMILPGISGSYVLVMLNQYEYMAGAVSALNLGIMGVFIAGALAGLFVMTKVLRWLIKRYHGQTITFLIGLMAGGLRTPFAKIGRDYVSLAVFGVLGAACVMLLFFLSRGKKESKQTEIF
jgi:putative membrane protein